MPTLDVLYHLSPTDNRDAIWRDGLRIMMPIDDDELVQPDGTPVRFPWVCLATTPQDAWQLLPRAARDVVDEWDVWQVWLTDTDRLEIRPDLGLRIREVRAMNALSPDRLWLVGTRDS